MYPIRGTAVEGKGQANVLGYPTANLMYTRDDAPEPGVWSCRVEHNGLLREGLAVIGMWTLANGLPSVEAHILDFTGDVYGQPLAVALMTKLRDLQTFERTDDLIVQIEKDIEEARAEFASLT